MREWAKIAAAIILLDPAELKTRNRICELDFNQEESLIVAKADVIFRTKFFDELTLKQQCFRFATDRVNFEIPNAVQ